MIHKMVYELRLLKGFETVKFCNLSSDAYLETKIKKGVSILRSFTSVFDP